MTGHWKKAPFDRGIVMVTLDAEQIWGYLDCYTEEEFNRRFPRTAETAPKLLELFCQAGISATWAVVGALSLDGAAGRDGPRFAGLPGEWIAGARAGDVRSAPLWYARPLVEQIRDALPVQEIGLHGGLTHLPWAKPPRSAELLRREIARGVEALREIGVTPRSFTFPRDMEAHHHLLTEHGIRCYRGAGSAWGQRCGRHLFGATVRLLSEVAGAPPPVVWPEQKLPGLWNIPSSLFLYSLSEGRARLAPFSRRIARLKAGIERAARARGVFHYYFHPENVVESRGAFSVMEEIVEQVARARDAGDVEVLTMSAAVCRLEGREREVESEGVLTAVR